MSWEAWYTIAVIGLVCIALVRSWGPSDAILSGGSLLVGIAGIISPTQVFSGFVNPGTLAIAGLFIVGAAMRDTGALENVAHLMFGRARSERAGLLRLAAPVSIMSAFFNNTPIVAMLMPVVSRWAQRASISPSRLLMPLSFLAILGGTCTLIGTSTNLAIDGLMLEARQSGAPAHARLHPMGLFEMAWLGLPFVLIGIAYMSTIGRRLLPDRAAPMTDVKQSPKSYLAELRIQADCRLIGQSVEDAGLRHLPGLFLTEIVRDAELMTPVAPQEVLREGDILTFSGAVHTIVDLERIRGLVPVTDECDEARTARLRDETLCEAVISPRSPLIGTSIRDADFRTTYGAAIIAVNRGGNRIRGRIGDIFLRAGDSLLLQTTEDFARMHRDNLSFYLVSALEDAQATRHERAPVCWALMVLLLVLMLVPQVPIVYAVFVVAGLMVATRCISPARARKSLDWQTLITIGSAFGLGHALQASGAAEALAYNTLGSVRDYGPHVQVFAIYLLTSVFAAVVSSKAAAVLMFAIALEAAALLEVSARPLVMAVAFAAASSLCTPLGYPTNLMVFGPGGYRFTDFLIVGIPLNLLFAFIGAAAIPFIWPLG